MSKEIERMKLTSYEKWEVVLSVISRLLLVVLIYLATFWVYPQFIHYPFSFIEEGSLFLYFWRHYRINIGGNVAYLLMALAFLLIGIYVACRQYRKRVEEIQLQRILVSIQYFADGNYDYRIPQVENEQMNAVVSSINRLVDSTQHAIEEERRIERTKDELIANVSHDIRTPLTSIIGYLDVIVNKQYHSEAEKNQYISIAHEKALSMSDLVEDLFLYTDSLQDTYQINREWLPLNLYLSQIAAEFELETNELGIEIAVEVSPEDLQAYIDPDKIARVFSNLISNAIKYGHGANLIRLRGEWVEEDQLVIMECRNNGRLLEAGEEDKIFERSYRTEKSRKASEPGSGLGLAIVKNLIELHGGSIYAFVEGDETVFRMEVPMDEDVKKCVE